MVNKRGVVKTLRRRNSLSRSIFSTAGSFVRVACLQNETAPEKLLNRYEKRFEKREKGSENDPKRV